MERRAGVFSFRSVSGISGRGLYLLLFRGLGVIGAAFRDAAPCREAPPLPDRSEQAVRGWQQHDFGLGGRAGSTKRAGLDFQSNQHNKMVMMRKLKSSSGTYWKNGKDAGRLSSWRSGRRRRQGRLKPQERPPLPEPCLTRALLPPALGRTARHSPGRAALSYPGRTRLMRGRCRAARAHVLLGLESSVSSKISQALAASCGVCGTGG